MKIKIWTEEQEPTQPHTCYIGAAIVGGAASLGGAFLQSNAAQNAAQLQSQAGQNAIAAQTGFFNQSKEALQPFISAGQGQIGNLTNWNDYTNPNSPLASLLKLTTPGADQNATLAQTPGYQFALQQGQIGVQNGLAARGLGGPGGALAKGSANYAEGLAGTQYSNIVQQLLNTYQAGGGALQNEVGLGANSAGNLASAAGQTGQGISSTITGVGNAQAASQTAQGNAYAGAANNAGTYLQNALTLNKLAGLYGNGGGSKAGS